jgi:hypothetical protein
MPATLHRLELLLRLENFAPPEGNRPVFAKLDTRPGTLGKRPVGLGTLNAMGQKRFTALLHHVNIDLLRSSYYDLKRQAAAGVDGVTWQVYGDGLEERLADLHGRIHRGAYRAQPSRRVWIDKDDGRKWPLGIAALEDKIVQFAVVQVSQPDLGRGLSGFFVRVPAGAPAA